LEVLQLVKREVGIGVMQRAAQWVGFEEGQRVLLRTKLFGCRISEVSDVIDESLAVVMLTELPEFFVEMVPV